MYNKILIANRGEIAVRIIRAAREMGIETVAVYSETDKDALHAQMADEAICIGPAKAKDSYLNIHNILSATMVSGAEAIHPGFGFLSENSRFAQMCEECNISFIGPASTIIEDMGNKSKAREIMKKAGVPIIPGSEGIVSSEEEAYQIAKEIGFPVVVKASAGGGGRGIRIVFEEIQFKKAFNTAKQEAAAAFGDDSMYIEKFIENPRHIEFQILGDKYGNVIHLGERDCSIQRKNQKVIEEAPSVIISDSLRAAMGEAAVKAAKAVGYESAGTIEFLLDKYGEFYFMEMNTRIQVEHPITEMVTGIDLVKEQIKIAAGEKLDYTQQQIKIKGHSIECRINAENPQKGFLPSPGKIEYLFMPGGFGVRVDTAAYNGYIIPSNYDSMIGKLIVYGNDRNDAITRMKRALGEFIVKGIETNIDFHFEIMNHPKYLSGDYDTGFIKKEFGY